MSKYKSYDELPLMLSVPEIAVVLGISRAAAYELARSRDFPSLRIGTRIVGAKRQIHQLDQQEGRGKGC